MVVEHGDVGGVDVVGPPRRRAAGYFGPEAREEPAPRLGLAHELRSGRHPGTVVHSAAVEAVRLDHAVAVEQVPVPEAEAFVHGRSVSVERAPELLRQASLDVRGALEAVGTGAAPPEQRRVGLECAGELARPARPRGDRAARREGC